MIDKLVYRPALKFHNRQVEQFLADARRAKRIQRRVLFDKICRCADSDFGRDHGFQNISTVAAFRRQVPIRNYEYYRPYIERVKRGDLQAMFAPGTKVLMFAMTSGTTDQSKFVPVTQEFFDEYRRSWFIWGARNYADHFDQARKKTLQLSSDWQQFETEAGIPCGNISGLAAEVRPFYTRPLFILPLPVIKIKDPAAKHYTALRIAMTDPRVGMIITANPSTLIEFARRANDHRESLIRDIHDGTLSQNIDVSPEIRQALSGQIGRGKPKRARELERIAESTGTLYPRDVWPGLSLLAVWMGGSVGVYLSQLKEFYGETVSRDHGLSASEGRMTIPVDDNTSAGVLDYLHHYYEFIPENDRDSDDPTVLEAHELEEGRNYFILLTTSSGLYRYDIHDMVRCVGFQGESPLLEFLNKGAHFSSFTGEKLSEFQVVSAVKTAFDELDLPMEHFTVAPTMNDRPGYVLLLEPSERPRDNQRLARSIEKHLEKLNCEYADKLESGRLRELVVQEIPSGTWQAFRDGRTAERGNLEEFKHPCLVSDLEFIDRLI